MKTNTFNLAYIVFISFIAGLGGYLFGFDFAVISGGLPFLQKEFNLNSYWEGIVTGSLALGAVLGSAIAANIANKFGRKKALMLAALVFILSSVAMGASFSRYFFVFSRFMAGVGVGMAALLSPMYIGELAPPKFRGSLVIIYQLAIVLGILVTNLVNYSLRNSGPDAWRWMFGYGVIPSAMFFIGIFLLPESPRWLIQNGKTDKAFIILKKIGNEIFAKQVLTQIQKSTKNFYLIPYKELFKKIFINSVLVGIGLAIFQQFCGINTIFNYTPKLFESIGASKDDQLLQTVFIGAVNLVFTFVAMFLVDKIGRKPLMLFGFLCMSILYLIITYLLGLGSKSVAWYLLATIGVYSASLAPVTWVLISEIFPSKIRVAANSLAVLSLWVSYFILIFTFPIVFSILKEKIFYIYSLICVLGFVFIYFYVKETKGKSLEEMDVINSFH